MSEHRSSYRYKHDSRKNMIAFTQGILLGEALNHKNEDVATAFNAATGLEAITGDEAATRKTTANKEIFCMIIRMIDNHDLLITLSSMYPGQGLEALACIKESLAET